MRISLFFFLLVYALNLLASSSFVRVNPDSGYMEVAIRTYENDAHDKVVLVPTIHMGDEKFYETLSRKMKGYIVIYELINVTLEQHKRVEDMLRHEAGPTASYCMQKKYLKTLFFKGNDFENVAHRLGLGLQMDLLRYDEATRIVHGDTETAGAPPERGEFSQDILEKYVLETKIPKKYRCIPGELCLIDKVCNISGALLGKLYSVAGVRANVAKTIADAHTREELSQEDKDRSDIAIDKLKGLLAEQGSPHKIMLVYGAHHMPYFELTFLNTHGFTPVEDKTEWIQVFDTRL